MKTVHLIQAPAVSSIWFLWLERENMIISLMHFALKTYQGAWFHRSADSVELQIPQYLKYEVCQVFRPEVTNNIRLFCNVCSASTII